MTPVSRPCIVLSLFLHMVLIDPARAVSGVAEPYLAVSGPCQLQFPRDHGPHPGYRTEWWYYTGNLHSSGGASFGFQLTFFRRQISPPGSERRWPERSSPWRAQEIVAGHAAVSDFTGGRFFHDEHMARAVLGLAGAKQTDVGVEVWVRDWQARIEPEKHSLRATGKDFSYELSLTPLKAPVAHGDSGYSRKGKAPESASCYYSVTRFGVSGQVSLGGEIHGVEGVAWMDHEFSSAPLESDLSGWDWFSLQLDDHTELMLYLLRNRTGGSSPASSGTLVAADGTSIHLPLGAFSVDKTATWTSPHSGAEYPSAWTIRVPSHALDLQLIPRLPDQELRTPESTGVTYWEGSVTVTGTSGGRPIKGLGYVELTGYRQEEAAPY